MEKASTTRDMQVYKNITTMNEYHAVVVVAAERRRRKAVVSSHRSEEGKTSLQLAGINHNVMI